MSDTEKRPADDEPTTDEELEQAAEPAGGMPDEIRLGPPPENSGPVF